MMRYRLVWAPLVALLVLVVSVVLGAATPATKQVLVDIALDDDDGERIEAIETDASQDNSDEISDEDAMADVEDEDEDEDEDAEPPAAAATADAKPTSASERLSFLSGAAARVAKVWHAAASGKRLPRFRDARTHKIAKAARVPGTGSASATAREHDHDHEHASVYVVEDPLVMEGYAAAAGAAPGVVAGHAGAIPSDEDDPMLQQGHAHHDATAYLEAGVEPDLELLYVRHRLQKLDFYFEFLKVMSEDCRQRMLCEVSKEPSRFYPLSSVLEDATSFSGSYQYVTSHLINTTEGARLLSYMEASYRGQDRGRSCAVFQYRCPAATEEMINYDALCLWREMVRWLTIHIVAPNN